MVPRSRAVRLDADPLIALARQHSEAAIDILGSALLDDLKGLRLVNPGTDKGRILKVGLTVPPRFASCSVVRGIPARFVGSAQPTISSRHAPTWPNTSRAMS